MTASCYWSLLSSETGLLPAAPLGALETFCRVLAAPWATESPSNIHPPHQTHLLFLPLDHLKSQPVQAKMHQEGLNTAWQIRGEEVKATHHVLCSLLPQGTLKSESKTTAKGAQHSIWAPQHPSEPPGRLSSATATALLQTPPQVKSPPRPLAICSQRQRPTQPVPVSLLTCICVQLVGTGLFCVFLSLWGLRVLYSRCTHTKQAATRACWWAEQIALLEAFSPAQICVGFCILSNFLFFLTKHMSPDWRWVSVVQPLPKVKWDLSFHQSPSSWHQLVPSPYWEYRSRWRTFL